MKVWRNETRERVRGTIKFIEKWLEMKTEKERDKIFFFCFPLRNSIKENWTPEEKRYGESR